MTTRPADLFDYDAELRRYHTRFRAAVNISARDRVLDIGCGTGQTTREAARAAVAGGALGVDISARMLELARQLSAEDGVGNVEFLQADAQEHRFPPGHFTLGISRFGTMFFTDPVAAFTNIRRALQPGARLVQLVWQSSDRQEWATAIGEALGGRRVLTMPPTADPFSLSDPARAEGILTAAEFTTVAIIEVCEPICYGQNTATALKAVLSLQMPRTLIAELDAAGAEHALDRLRTVLADHEVAGGVWFDSCAWLITARTNR